MGYVITLAAQKGGCGRSTLTISLGGYWNKCGRSVLLIDADPPQNTVLQWSNYAKACDVVVAGTYGAALERDIPKLAGNYDVTIVDCGARVDRQAMAVADIVIVPVQQSANDLWSLDATLQAVKAAQAVRPHMQAGLVLNRADTRTALGKLIRKQLGGYPVPVVGRVGQRIAIAEAILAGSTPCQYQGSNSKAATEIEALAKTIERMLIDGKKTRQLSQPLANALQ